MEQVFFNCGLFLGEDQGAKPLFAVLDDLEAKILPEQREVWQRIVVAPLQAQLRELSQQEQEPLEPDRVLPHLEVGLEMVEVLALPLRSYFYGSLGDQNLIRYPEDSESLFPFTLMLADLPPELAYLDKAWCAGELLMACDRALKIRQPVGVHFGRLQDFALSSYLPASASQACLAQAQIQSSSLQAVPAERGTGATLQPLQLAPIGFRPLAGSDCGG